jgi:hypothetical protein
VKPGPEPKDAVTRAAAAGGQVIIEADTVEVKADMTGTKEDMAAVEQAAGVTDKNLLDVVRNAIGIIISNQPAD